MYVVTNESWNGRVRACLHRHRRAPIAFLAATLVAIGLQVGTAGPSGPVTTCAATLSIDATPVPIGSRLLAIDAIATNNIWAVGSQGTSHLTSLVEHFDGTSWTATPSPSLPGVLYAVAAVTSTDVWAVGRGVGDSTIAEHWDGSQWTSVPTPNPTPPAGVTGAQAFLQGLAIRSSNDIWAVGAVGVPNLENGVLEHWDGTSWTASSDAPPGAELRFATVVPGGDIWAVGATYLPQSKTTNLALHYDGTTWQTIATPNPSSFQNLLHGVVAISSTDAWAVGFDAPTNGVPAQAQSMHWDGVNWALVPMVVPSSGVSRPRHVVALSSSDVWATGDDQAGALIEHWNGSVWSLVSGPQAIPLPFAIGSLGESEILLSGNNSDIEAVCPNQVSDAGMGMTPVHASQDLATAWHVTSSATTSHTVTDGTGLGLFDSGPIAPGGSYLVTLAGAGWYTVKDSMSAHIARLSVPVTVSPASGTSTTNFTITAAAADLPAALVEDVQIKRPGTTAWSQWKVLTETTGFNPGFIADGGVGTYSFRSRTRNPTSRAATDYSLTATLSVS